MCPGKAVEHKIEQEEMSDKKRKYPRLVADHLLIGTEGKKKEILTGAISKEFKDIT